MRIVLLTLIVSFASVGWAAPETPVTTAQTADETDQKIASLIQQLGDREFAVRERAQRELARMGLDAFDALTAAKNSDDAEIAAQARYLVRQIRFEWARATDPVGVQDILKDYEGQAPASRLAKINQLATMSDLASLEWLCRLARFEESQIISKEAALKAMERDVPKDPHAAEAQVSAIERIAARGKRPAALWLKNYAVERKNPEAAMAGWDKLVDAEEQVIDKESETSPRLVSELLRRQVALYDKLNRPDDALNVISKLVRLERGEAQSLMTLVDWLRERKAWPAIDEVSNRFAAVFNAEPILLYTLAQARKSQGNVDLAEETAQKALALNGDKPEEHYVLAGLLQQRGLNEWADREFRFVIDKLPPAHRWGIASRLLLSEDLHDRLREADAAESLRPIVEALEKNDDAMKKMLEAMDREPGSIKSRAYYFESNDAVMKGDSKKQFELLERGIASDPNDADVLIAMYRLPNQDEAYRKRVKELIEKAAEKFRNDINEFPDEPAGYNQFAWLIGNTEGNKDEAIQFSHKSVELRRAGGYLDTLGHCYYGKGDYENAVKYQNEAAKLDPHSQAISRQLKVFQAALEGQKK